jgi:nitroreductase
MEFNKPVAELIRKRTSIRLYKQESVPENILEEIEEYISNVKGPFDSEVALKIITDANISKDSGIKLGTYGIIKGASTFIAAVTKDETKNLLQTGYVLEKVILHSTSLGLGTCWMGGTFKRSEFEKAVELKNYELLPIVSPLGYPAEHKGIVSSLMSMAAKSGSRKPWPELFYDGNFSHPLSEEAAGEFTVPLEMVRLAPSASNKQPWRILKDGKIFHFYLAHSAGYDSLMKFDIQKIDIGIAMCHFDTAAGEVGLNGIWLEKAPEVDSIPKNTEYIVSWILR